MTILVFVARANAVRFDVEHAPFMSVAYNTIVCLGLLVIAVLLIEPYRGFLKLFNSDTFGGSMARRLLPVAVLAPIILSRLSMEGRERGWYDENLTAALSTLGSIGVFSVTVYAFAVGLHRVDRERRRAREAESAVATRLRHLNDELMQFTYSASHDIKGPLTTILGLSRLAAEDTRTGNAAEAQLSLRHIERRALALSTLLDDTLALNPQ
jgi:signal transduction histidine kinase